MTGQDRHSIEKIINRVRETGEQVISLNEVDVQVFRNLYHISKNLETDLDVEITEPGKQIRIFKK
jgi:hypothetical protein